MGIGDLIHAIIDTPGIGGIIVVFIYILAIAIFVYLTRWILAGGKDQN